LGQWLRDRLSPRVFRQCFMVSLALLGAYQAAQGLTG
ncbi:sulfite exporter TauE/SafE family protein, partial [Paraburkholderia sp. SIMBA_050]